MLAYRYPLIAREGWIWIAAVVIPALIVHAMYGLVSLPLWLLALVLLFLFRDPARKIPAVPLGIVSPVDGKVVAVDKVYDAYLNRQALLVSIKMGFTSVYSAHSPMEGKVLEQWLEVPRKIDVADVSGKANTSTSTTANAPTKVATYAQWIQSDEDDDVVLVIEVNSRRPRPQCYAQSGERIGQGQRCGFIHFGSQVDVLIPTGSRISVSVGDDVLAGSDIIATLVHAKAVPPKPVKLANA
ncbi:MAG: phosphatidylserine decarboxylase [Ectothiorhodospiraceae bacterium]|nr:phosphatidylserine decarboxylase [Ectothiorhodospiraceae bacterium]